MHKAYLSIMSGLAAGLEVLVTTTSNKVRVVERVDRNFCYFDDGTYATIDSILTVDIELYDLE